MYLYLVNVKKYENDTLLQEQWLATGKEGTSCRD